MDAAQIFALMLVLSPPERAVVAQRLPGWEETVDARTARYHAIADDLAAVVTEAEPLEGSRRGTAALLLAVAAHESGFAPDVDRGPCYRGKDGTGARCDSGRAACLLQLQAPARERARLFADRRQCLRTGLERLRRSLGQCRGNLPDFRLAAYASGSCSRGLRASREIVRLWRRVELLVPVARPGA